MTGRFLMGLDSLHSTDTQSRSTPHSGMTERINLHRFLLDKINLARLETIDLESLRQGCIAIMGAQQAITQSMESTYPHSARINRQHSRQTREHLF